MQVILLLYVDDLFLTGDEELIADSKRRLEARSVAETRRDYFESREVCYGDTEKIWDDGLQTHVYSDDDEPEVIW